MSICSYDRYDHANGWIELPTKIWEVKDKYKKGFRLFIRMEVPSSPFECMTNRKSRMTISISSEAQTLL